VLDWALLIPHYEVNYILRNVGNYSTEALNPSTKHGCAPHNDVSNDDGPHIRQWSHKIMIL